MAHFRADIHGCRGVASRLGTKGSGLLAHIGSWSGGVRVHLYHQDGEDYARVELMKWHGAGTDKTLYDGPVSGAKKSRRAA